MCVCSFIYLCVFCSQDTLLVSEVVAGIPQKAKERRLFLFEQIIILSEMIERKKGDFSNASYIFKNSLKVQLGCSALSLLPFLIS